jgi:hypothetical protein
LINGLKKDGWIYPDQKLAVVLSHAAEQMLNQGSTQSAYLPLVLQE